MPNLDDLRAPLVDALAAAFGELLTEVEGQDVYAAAVAVAQGLAWRPDLATVEAEGGDDEWWPDEWTAVPEGVDAPELAAIEAQVEQTMPDDEDALEEWLDEVYDLLVGALGSAEVRAVFAAAGSDPVLMVSDTDEVGEAELRAFDALNAAHPRRDVARAYWVDEAEDTDLDD